MTAERASIHLRNKRRLRQGLAELADAGPIQSSRLLGELSASDAEWRVAHPINLLKGTKSVLTRLLEPLKRACPDLERRDLIFVGGSHEGRDYVAAVGHYCGTFRRDWLTIPATGRPVYLRYGEIYQIAAGKIVQASLLWDIVDLIRQAGFQPLAQSLGLEGAWPAPITGDGIILRETDAAISTASLAQSMALQRALAEHDDGGALTREALLKMPQKKYWHPKLMWHGASGIGMARGLQELVDCHQLPFRIAFGQQRGAGGEVVAERRKQGDGHHIGIGDGNYSVIGGWPSVHAVHSGSGFAATTPTGRPVTMRIMDFYLHHEGLIRENWMALDMLDLLNQLGLDVIARMQGPFRRGA